ncbi:MAG: hypothetical protein VYA30_11815 [Myxococcota bacterium]|nr:hypothetical protein [Myxococcota bacterium]
MDGNLVVNPGTVIIANESSHAIRIQGQAQIGSRDGLVVFSKSDRQAWSDEDGAGGGWLGLRIETGEEPINVLNTVIEYGGFGGEPAVIIDERTVVFEALTLQGNQRVGLAYTGQTSVNLVGSTLADVTENALDLGDGVSIGQLSELWTRAPVPVSANVRSFGRLPIGAGHDWGSDHAGIRLRGSTGTMRLANQPAGVYYTIENLAVAAVDTFSVPPTVPLKITGPLSVSGTLAITGGGRLDALNDGLVTITPSGILSLTASDENRLVFGPAVDQIQSPWPGLVIEGQLDGGFVTVRNGGLTLNSDFGQLTGLEMDGTSNPLTISASGDLVALAYRSDTHPIQITAGEGRITGTISTTAELDVQFMPLELCDLWNLDQLVRDDGENLRSNCN